MMELRLPPIRDLNLHDDMRQPAHPPSQGPPVVRDERLQKVLTLCQALCAFADHYASTPPPPGPPEIALMVDRAVEVITILQEYKQAICPPSPPSRPPKRPWEDTTDDIATPRPAPSPPAERIPSPVSAPPSPSNVPPPAQESQMTVFDGQPERQSTTDDRVKAAAIRDIEDIRARRGQGNGSGKVKYKKRSRATPPGNCHSCEIADTPEWRRGPDGQRTLCNACGLHYAKLVRKRDRIISSLPAGGEAPPPIDIAFLRRSARMAAENSAIARSSAGRRRSADKDRSKANNQVATSSKPVSAATDDGRRNWERRDKETEPIPHYTHPAVAPPTYSAPSTSISRRHHRLVIRALLLCTTALPSSHSFSPALRIILTRWDLPQATPGATTIHLLITPLGLPNGVVTGTCRLILGKGRA
ncbi:unnamed protein product [Rhizoctonia solani]|uniref:GATA-type domain-containing protein n=1 Tax=Rhizoctonia solani TaxID=456999 RepID=A0A8H3CVK8_9AGAM|nr:unnamed protein product [Rhizoctonia solani]